jgi:hypothetical protein
MAGAVPGCSVDDVIIVNREPHEPAAGGDRDSAAAASPIAEDQFFPELAKAVCENIGPCCSAENKPFEPGKCEASLLTRFRTSSSGARDAAAYDARAARLCVDAYRSVVESCFRSTDITPCSKVSSLGTSRPAHSGAGDPCDTNCHSWGFGVTCSSLSPGSPLVSGCYDEDGLYCPRAGSEPHTCRARGSVGAECPEPDGCMDSWCSNGTCAPLLGAAAQCSDTSQCAQGLYCDLPAPAAGIGICRQTKIDGSPCNSDEACTSGFCDLGKNDPTCGNKVLSIFAGIACVQ